MESIPCKTVSEKSDLFGSKHNMLTKFALIFKFEYQDCLGYFFREEFKGIYKGEFSQIDFRHRHDQVVKRIREDWGQTQLSEELLRRIDGILDVNSVEHRVGT